MSEEAFPADAVVDIDDPSTWPAAVIHHVESMAGQLRSTTEYTNDLNIPIENEDDFRSLLSGCLVRAYHATRLLDHEVKKIRAEGLRLLSAELVEERINAAFNHSYISEEERALLQDSHVCAAGEEHGRVGETSLFFPESYLAEQPFGFIPLLTRWGGEAISKSSRAPSLPAHLKRLGTPSIVVAHIDLSAGQWTHPVFTQLSKVFVGRLLNLTDARANVHYRTPIPPHNITDIWQPGVAEYDRFEELPSS